MGNTQYENNLNMVQSKDLEPFLKSIGELDKIKSGKRKCKYCKEKITLQNLFVVFPESGDFKFVCREKECISQAMISIRNKNG